MAYGEYELNWIYDRTDGDCHLCGKKLSFINYARFGFRGAWEVEHSIPRSMGGTDHLNNLFAACITCNRSKRACSTRVCRSQYGRRRAPYRKETKQQIIRDNTITGSVIGGAVGLVGGPWGSALGAYIGGRIGRSLNPND